MVELDVLRCYVFSVFWRNLCWWVKKKGCVVLIVDFYVDVVE